MIKILQGQNILGTKVHTRGSAALWAVCFTSMADCFEETHVEVLDYLMYSCGVPESQGLTGKPPFKCMVLPLVPILEMHFAILRPISGQGNRTYIWECQTVGAKPQSEAN